LVEALEHHRAGRLTEAEALYRAVLEKDPANADAHHLLGMLAHSAGRALEAAALIAHAIKLRSDVAPFHNNLGLVLAAAGKPEQALLCYQQALTLAPDYVEACINTGNALQSLLRFEDAAAFYQRAIELCPCSAEARNNLGNVKLALGDNSAAEEWFRSALRLQPGYAEAWLNLSGALNQQDRLEEAAEACLKAVQAKPELAEAWSNLAAVLSVAERYSEAGEAARRALIQKPGLAGPHVILAAVSNAQGQYGEAETWARRALQLKPDYAEAHNNLANALQEQERLAEAETNYKDAVRLKPALADAHYNLGNLHRLCLRLPEATASYREALRLKPQHVKAHWNLALTLLLAGDLKTGWEEFEWRWRRRNTPPRAFSKPAWNGEHLNGQTILLYSEQGLGDTLQFIRYASLVRAAGGRVIFECPQPLLGLLVGVEGVDLLTPEGSTPEAFDVRAPLLSLPRLLGTTQANIPAPVPYIQVSEVFREKWRRRLAGARGPKAGLVWAGNPKNAEDKQRSLHLEQFAPLARLAGIRWYSLQFGPRSEEADHPPAGMGIENLGAEVADFRDAAAAIEQLDLLISADTAMAHLAGSLAAPVWTLLPYLPDWRWQLGRCTTPWYPTMRLVRQPARGDWDSVTKTLALALEKALSAKSDFIQTTKQAFDMGGNG
jgi:tetratricopeptide (TPR) repeat protein